MPILTIQMFEGRSHAQKEHLMRTLTEAVCAALGSAPQDVRILIQEISKQDYAIGGVSVHARDCAKDAE